MIRTIRLQNFMSHEDTLLELADGLTVLVGPNNCGKSAVVAALQAVCENTRGSAFVVRHEHREARVTVTTSEGDEIVWIRRSGSAAYELNGVRYDRLPSGPLPELSSLLRMPSVKIDANTEIDVHVGSQKSPIFLLNETGSRPAAFFAASSDAGRLLEMQRLHRSRKQRWEREAKSFDAEIAKLESQLEALAGIDALRLRLDHVDLLAAEIRDGERDQSRLTIQRDALTAHLRAVERRRAEVGALQRLESPPPFRDPQSLAGLIGQIARESAAVRREQDRLKRLHALQAPPTIGGTEAIARARFTIIDAEAHRRDYEALLTMLARLAAPPELVDPAPAANALHALKSVESDRRRHEALAAALAGVTPPPAVADLQPLEQLGARLVAAQRGVGVAAARATLLDRVQAPPELTDVSDLYTVINDLRLAIRGASECAAQVRRVESDLEAGAEEVRQWAARNPACPTCGGAVETDLVLREAVHVH